MRRKRKTDNVDFKKFHELKMRGYSFRDLGKLYHIDHTCLLRAYKEWILEQGLRFRLKVQLRRWLNGR